MSKPGNDRLSRNDFIHFHKIETRWADNDIYGHVNNVAYYSFFDTAVNCYLIDHCDLDIHGGSVIGLVVETGCTYFAPIAYPDSLEIGVRVAKLGNSSVIYELSVFKPGVEEAVAQGRFTHVYVDAAARRPVPLPEKMRAGLMKITG